jgi:hypothetical protein
MGTTVYCRTVGIHNLRAIPKAMRSLLVDEKILILDVDYNL